MSNRSSSRRDFLVGSAVGVAAATLMGGAPAQAQPAPAKHPFSYCLNTSTIRGQKLTLPQEIELAAKAGFTAMEPWIREIEDYVKAGGNLPDLKKRFADSGIAVVDVIGFAPWLMGGDEDGANAKNMAAMQKDMELAAQIGALRIAAPPAGAYKLENLDLKLAARRYRQVLELGEKTGVMPMLEIWGGSKALSNISEALFVTSAAKHPKATILTDVYHMYKGGSGVEALALINGSALPVMHFNDYPAEPPRDKISDEHRIYPGDGIAPLTEILRTLAANGARTALSLELFNKVYWQQDAGEVLKVAMEKMRGVVEKAVG